MLYSKSLILSVFIIIFPQLGFAAGLSGSVSDAISIVINISENIGSLQQLVVAFLYFSGIGFFIKALYHLKVYGEARTMMATQTSMKQPLTWMCVGMAFIALPTTIEITLNTFFASNNGILSYEDWNKASGDLLSSQLMSAIFSIVQLVGLISFSRGWFIIAQAAQHQGGGQATMGKGLIHIVGGIMGLNIVQTINILDNTINA